MGTFKAAEEDGWAIDDPVTQLRIRGDERVFELPLAEPRRPLVVGAADDCDLVLRDPTGCVSRHHAHLVRERAAWILQDQGSTNGIRQDGERRLAIQLAPGVEIEIGDIKLIAESRRLRSLRDYLSRVVGWDRARFEDVEHGIQAIRATATRRAALVLPSRRVAQLERPWRRAAPRDLPCRPVSLGPPPAHPDVGPRVPSGHQFDVSIGLLRNIRAPQKLLSRSHALLARCRVD